MKIYAKLPLIELLQLSTPVEFFTSTNIVTVKKVHQTMKILSLPQMFYHANQDTLLQQRSVTPKVHHTKKVLTQQKKNSHSNILFVT